ncbi:MAG TPA: heparinase II/III-family protein, partial [Bryobacteraceae bacterium]|nr:heparinase II/III-family protein [Bryobacteraceae bacterium]
SFGVGTAGHSHSDTLSLVVRHAGEQILADAGTYCYVGDQRARDWFRGSAAHNTLRIDRQDQARPAGPFRWLDLPVAELMDWQTWDERDYLDAACRHRGFQHRRRLLFAKAEGLLFVLDEVDGPPGVHLLELFWHPGEAAEPAGPGCFRIGRTALLAVAGPVRLELSRGGEHGWRSTALYERSEAQVIRAHAACSLPAQVATVIDFSGAGIPGQAELLVEARGAVVCWTGAGVIRATFGRHAILDKKC